MPYFLVDGESVYDRLREPRFHLLVFSNSEDEAQALKAEIESRDTGLFDFNQLKLSTQVTELFGTGEPFVVLLRPDNHIGSISSESAPSILRSYLNEFVRLP